PAQRPAVAPAERARRARERRGRGARAVARAVGRGRRPDAARACRVGAGASPRARMSRPRGIEAWISLVRLGAVPFAVLQISTTSHMSSSDRTIAWILTAILAAGGCLFYALGRYSETRWFS